MEERIETLHPQGKKGVHISLRKYEAIRRRIIEALQAKGGLTFSVLVKEIEGKLAGSFEGNIPWYAESVKLDLEARGIIVRIRVGRSENLHLVKPAAEAGSEGERCIPQG